MLVCHGTTIERFQGADYATNVTFVCALKRTEHPIRMGKWLHMVTRKLKEQSQYVLLTCTVVPVSYGQVVLEDSYKNNNTKALGSRSHIIPQMEVNNMFLILEMGKLNCREVK